MSVSDIAPVRLRPTDQTWIGTTAFFRNRPLLRTLLSRVAGAPPDRMEVLIHACSSGAEVYSLLIAWRLHPLLKHIPIEVTACDISASFLEMVRAGEYPAEILTGLSSEEASFFEPGEDGCVVVSPELRSLVTVVGPASFVNFDCPGQWDLVILNNAMIYVAPDLQAGVYREVAGYNRRWLVTSAFYMDTIASDLSSSGYRPITDDMEAIHGAWRDRQADPSMGTPLPPWALPPFSRVPDYEYRYCAFFERKGG